MGDPILSINSDTRLMVETYNETDDVILNYIKKVSARDTNFCDLNQSQWLYHHLILFNSQKKNDFSPAKRFK